VVRKAAEQNGAEAQFALGFCYAKGEGVEKEPDRGREMVPQSRRAE